jgi:L-threonylcarbamoyladenylate synthase
VTGVVDRAVEAATSGRLVVMPTDTVYGIGTRPDDPAATARLFRAKGRSRTLTLPVLVATPREAERIAVLDDRARDLAERHWPGALTMVLPRSPASAPWDLGDERHSIGVRVPDHPIALAILRRTGPLAVTSANRSGQPTPGSCEELRAVFGNAVAVYVCQDDPPPGIASTVVDVTGDPRVVRAGAVEIG